LHHHVRREIRRNLAAAIADDGDLVTTVRRSIVSKWL